MAFLPGPTHSMPRASHPWRFETIVRTAAGGLCLATFGLACMLMSVAGFPLIRLTSRDAATARRRVRRWVHYYYRFFIGMGRITGVLSYELQGGERLAAPGQLVVCNHPSLIDVMLIGTRMPQVSCIVKQSVLHNLFLRGPVRWAGYIPNHSPAQLIGTCAAALRAGESLLVFPEGTRSEPGQPLKLQRGAAHIALASGCDLLPVTIVCHPSSMTKSDVWYRVPAQRPHWRVTVGEPIRLADLVLPGDTRSQAARRITDHLAAYYTARIGLPAPQPSVCNTGAIPVTPAAAA